MLVEYTKWIDLPNDVRKIVHSAEAEAEELKAWIEAEVGEVSPVPPGIGPDTPVTAEVSAKKNTKQK